MQSNSNPPRRVRATRRRASPPLNIPENNNEIVEDKDILKTDSIT